MLMTLLKHTFQNGGQRQEAAKGYPITRKVIFLYIAATVFALHLGKTTAIMSSILMTLVTNNINTVNRVKSDTDCDFISARWGLPDPQVILRQYYVRLHSSDFRKRRQIPFPGHLYLRTIHSFHRQKWYRTTPEISGGHLGCLLNRGNLQVAEKPCSGGQIFTIWKLWIRGRCGNSDNQDVVKYDPTTLNRNFMPNSTTWVITKYSWTLLNKHAKGRHTGRL